MAIHEQQYSPSNQRIDVGKFIVIHLQSTQCP